jgi:hypothetical protein
MGAHAPHRISESGQAMVEYIMVVGVAMVGLLIVLDALVRSALQYYEMQAIWISLPIM